MTWERLLDWVMRLLSAQDGKADRLESMADRAMLEDVCRELGTDVSMARLRAGLRVVLAHG